MVREVRQEEKQAQGKSGWRGMGGEGRRQRDGDDGKGRMNTLSGPEQASQKIDGSETKTELILWTTS